MKLPIISLLFAGALALSGVAADAPASYPPHTLPNSQLRALPVNAAGRHYQLHISLPGNYQRDTGKRYPVVYVTDAYWDFAKIEGIRGGLMFDKVVPEFIVVGLGYAGEKLDYEKLRLWELAVAPLGPPGGEPQGGHAADFLQTIEKEIIPMIDREFRTDPEHRVLAGASLGGEFTLYAMYAKPGLFWGYIAATPAVQVGDFWLLKFAEQFAKDGGKLKGRLFASAGEYEWPGHVAGIKRFDALLRAQNNPDLAYQFKIIEGERHAGMQFESYVRGLRHVFAPLAPETGVQQ